MHYAIGGLGQQCSAGSDPHEAILTSSLSRIQPILITTVTTILGVSPLIISKDPLFCTLALIGIFCGRDFDLDPGDNNRSICQIFKTGGQGELKEVKI